MRVSTGEETRSSLRDEKTPALKGHLASKIMHRSGPNLAVGREDPHQWMQQQGKAVQAYNGPGRAGTYHGARAVVGRGYPSPSGIGYPSPGAGGYPSASPGHPQHHPYSAATLNHYRSASPHNYPQSPRHRNMVLSGAVQVNSEPDGDSVSSSSTKMDFKKKRLKPGGVSGIKPPQVKRSSDAPVTLKGWLYKQGSDGLMLWKKRWFVLSEFCLYYYKGSEEEKQLGSILLPSYKISPCSSDDRVFRKWAFKIEHQNMRTYFFAAENKDSMLQWMNALSLASIMHKDNREKPGDGDGGFGARRPRSMDGKHWADVQHQPRISDPRLNVSYDMDPRASGKENRQPLYANAPPKPKRLNTSRDNSYSPDRTSSDKEMGDYGEMPHRQHPQDQGGYMPPVTRHQQYLNHNGERRTPDAYARSRVGPEYEDAYRNGQPVPYYNQMQPYHRPHSADFLEHPVMRTKPAGANRTDPYVRPKSSVEQYNASEYWSEESYAQAMRGQSAIYTPPGMQTGTYVPPVQTSPVRSAKRSSFKQLPNGMYPVSPPVNHHSPQPQTPQMMPDQQNFIRSASARLPRYKIPIDGHMNSTYPDDGSGYIDRKKMQQREESMKRLLEWKQRMLQSPLTRKSSPKPDSPKPHSDMERYRKQVLQELAHHEGRRPAGSQRSPAEQSAWRHRHPSAGPQPRSSREPQYNSYSSDDEDSIAAMTRENLVVKAAQQNHHAQFAEQPSRSPKKSPLRGVESGSETGSTPPPPAPAPAPVPPAPSTSSGDLSSKSHEELVLLLIQLRRQSSGILKSIEGCQKELDAQKRIIDMEASSPSRDGHLVRHRKLADQLNELQTQYEIQRPLIHLVDNMVKLGSIYGEGGQGGRMRAPEEIQEKLDFNHWIQERRMVAQDRKQWEKESPDQQELEAKIEQLYHLEVILRREAKVLQTLQKDKELLEGALQSVRLKLQQLGNSNPQEMEKLQRQQQQLERELGHVRSQLLQSSKKLEEAETENSRLEHELMVLRQKVLLALKHATSLQAHNLATQQLESELMRVQQLTRDLQRRRMELSKQVQQLTERCETSGSTLPKPTAQVRPSPSGVAGAAPIPARRKHSDVWLETDLDSAVSMDRGVDRLTSEIPPHLYVNTSSYDDSFWYMSREDPYGEKQGIAWEDQMDHTYQKATYHQPVYQTYQPPPPPPPPPPTSSVAHIALGDGSHMFMDISEADDRMKRFYGILPKEKSLEIKTVRTVKREAQQRQKRRPSMESGPGIPGRPSDEEPDEEDPDPATVIENDPVLSQFQRSMSLPRSYGLRKYPNWKEPMNSSHINHPAVRQQQAVLLRRSAANLRDYEDSVDAAFIGSSSPSVSPPSPKYRSETAQAIIQEMHLYRRKIPREKRKHITVSSSRPVTLETVRKSATWRGARDDLELSGGQLGQNLGHTPAAHRHSTPDVVKSTMPHRKEVKYNEETIDTILGTPQKILIPERYVPEDAVLSKEEQAERSRKAEAIKKMLLSESALASSEDGLGGDPNEDSPSLMKQKVALERRQREQLLSLSQTLAREASARTRRVAAHHSPPSPSPDDNDY